MITWCAKLLREGWNPCLSACQHYGVIFPSDSIPEVFAFCPNVAVDTVTKKCEVQRYCRVAVGVAGSRAERRRLACRFEHQRISISADGPAWHAGDGCAHMAQTPAVSSSCRVETDSCSLDTHGSEHSTVEDIKPSVQSLSSWTSLVLKMSDWCLNLAASSLSP